MLDIKRLSLPKSGRRAAAVAAVICMGLQAPALAQQGETPPSSKGENFSAKPPAALFASDCTGAGCHKGPQGLAKAGGIGLAGFLREHYTNSRESAAALASYLAKLPSGPEPKEKSKERETRTSRPSRPAPGGGEGVAFPSSSEPGGLIRPEPREARTPRQPPSSRTSRAPAHPAEEAPDKSATSAAHGHPPAAATATVPETAPTPPPAPVAQAPAPPAPPPQASAPPPAPKHFDIFD